MKLQPPLKTIPWQAPELSLQTLLFHLAISFVFNTIIALFLHLIGKFGASFFIIFVLSQCIGLSITVTVKISFHLLNPQKGYIRLFLLVAAILLGTLIGFSIWSLCTGIHFEDVSHLLTLGGQTLLLGLFFGLIIANFFISRSRIMQIELHAQEERSQRLALEKQAAETELRLLQAQIEPHFLFNTLSTLLSLLETDIVTGQKMLEDLIHYLRTSLATTRRDQVTLGQEMDLVLAYLKIYKVRMGERLNFSITIPEDLRQVPFSPMLIQPLVENAILHGLEPAVEGGEVAIKAVSNKGVLTITVSDTGSGLAAVMGKGLGLQNIKERLASIYGGKGSISLSNNSPAGLVVTIEVPHG